MLEACQYLPDIVQLQRQMFDEFHHRIKHRVSRNETMQEFIRRRRTGIQLYMREYQPFMIDIACYNCFFSLHCSCFTEHMRNEYKRMVASLQKAWNLVRDTLKDHGMHISIISM